MFEVELVAACEFAAEISVELALLFEVVDAVSIADELVLLIELVEGSVSESFSLISAVL